MRSPRRFTGPSIPRNDRDQAVSLALFNAAH